MIKYFRELLATLKSIDKTNKEIKAILDDIDLNLARCVVKNGRRHGTDHYLVTGHWND
tara:strand:+ start:28 stop:201 length:174 start_codon:yes stop_codon:yes gene_type:complete